MNKSSELTVVCEKCNASVEPEHVERTTMMADCQNCKHHFLVRSPKIQQLLLSKEITRCEDVIISKTTEGLRIVRPWRNTKTMRHVTLAGILNVVLLVQFLMAAGNVHPLLSILSFILLLGGLLVIYIVVAELFNSSIFNVSNEKITVQVGPLPWFGIKEIPKDKVKKLYCLAKAPKVPAILNPILYAMLPVAYNVFVYTTEGEHIQITRGLQSMEHAAYIQKEISALWAL